jgi:hypothetical protein
MQGQFSQSGPGFQGSLFCHSGQKVAILIEDFSCTLEIAGFEISNFLCF